MRRLPVISTCLFLLMCVTNTTEAQFSIDGQYRSRFEYRDGYQKLAAIGSVPAVLVSQCTRISFIYQSENLKLRISPQDVRVWGDVTSLSSTGTGDNPSLDILEAFTEVRIVNNTFISVGRQQLKYDSYRLLGDRNWNQNSIAYDALVLKIKRGDFNAHAGATWNTSAEALSNNYYTSGRVKTLSFLWLNRSFGDGPKLSLLHISSGTTKNDSSNVLNYRHTTGLYSDFKRKNLSIWGNAYYQYGKNQSGKPVSALLYDVDGSYTLTPVTIGLGGSYLSGNCKVGEEADVDNLFDPLNGNRHRYFGFIDYFRSFSSHTKQAGLVDCFAYIDYKITKSLNLRCISHYFRLAQTNANTPDDKRLGYENDLVLKYKFSDWGAFEGGYCFFLPTATLKSIQNVADARFSQFLYLQMTLTPTLFKQ